MRHFSSKVSELGADGKMGAPAPLSRHAHVWSIPVFAHRGVHPPPGSGESWKGGGRFPRLTLSTGGLALAGNLFGSPPGLP